MAIQRLPIAIQRPSMVVLRPSSGSNSHIVIPSGFPKGPSHHPEALSGDSEAASG